MTRAWLLNFEADEELARPEGPRRLRPDSALACRLLRARALLVPRGDRLVAECARGEVQEVRCWMPTRRALATVKQLGLPVPVAPRFEVLRAVNSRRFSTQLGSGPPGTRWIESEAELDDALRAGGDWLLRTAHGFAGRGRHLATILDAATLAFARAALARDAGFELAPRVQPERELALHGYVDRSGGTTLGAPTLSHVDAHGQWRRTSLVRSGELSESEHAQLQAAALETAAALHAAGYFGPFGIDAFRYRTAHGTGFCPRSEINARYTMAWGRGMAGKRVDLC